MIKAHQIQLNPTPSQKRMLHKSFGCARHSYNWALAKWKEMYEAGEKPSAYTLVKLQNSVKVEQMPFYLDVNKCAVQYAIHDLEKAFKNFFAKRARYPKFKKRGSADSFVVIENHLKFKQEAKKIWLPRIGWVRCYEDLRFDGKVNNVVVKRIADKYFAVVNIEVAQSIPILKPSVGENQAIVGIDLGIKSMMVLSDGTIYDNPKALKSNLKKLRRYQRALSRKKIGSRNRKKQQLKLARLHYRIANIRKNAIHQATAAVVKNYDTIVIETLKPSNMVKNKKLAQSVSDVSFAEIARQLTYKTDWNGKTLIKADQWFPSSKLCSCCGYKKETLKLSERTYNCVGCGVSIDRDLNAARNLASYGATVKSTGSHACGDWGSGLSLSRSLKQEDLLIFNNN